MLEEIWREDVSLVDNMAAGFELTGVLPRSHVFISKFKPADQSGVQLRRGAKRLRDGLLAAVKPSPDIVVAMPIGVATKEQGVACHREASISMVVASTHHAKHSDV